MEYRRARSVQHGPYQIPDRPPDPTVWRQDDSLKWLSHCSYSAPSVSAGSSAAPERSARGRMGRVKEAVGSILDIGLKRLDAIL